MQLNNSQDTYFTVYFHNTLAGNVGILHLAQ